MIYKLVVLIFLIVIIQQHEIEIGTTINRFFTKIGTLFRNETFTKFYDNLKLKFFNWEFKIIPVTVIGSIYCEEKGKTKYLSKNILPLKEKDPRLKYW